jgi:sugar lactone lactonase YvrE
MPDYNNLGGTWGYFTSAQLAAGGSQTMAFSTSIPSDVLVSGMAADGNGTLWMLDNNNGAFDAFKAASGFLNPTSVDTLLPAFNYAPFGAAFDPAGNLWTLNDAANQLVELTTAQLASGGNSNPRIVNWVGTVDPNFNPRALAFDASGTLWLINRHVGNNTLEGFTQAQLSAGGSQAAAMTIVLPDSFVRALAFDANGNLWVPFFAGQHVAKYTPAQLAAGGSPTPTVSIGVAHPTGLTFDASGNLWIVDAVDGQLFELGASQLTTSGTPTPITTMPLPVASGSFDPQQPFFLVFNPHASNLPLNGSRVVRRHR